MKFLVINGPNLNMMHFTEPGVAGQLDYNGLLDYLELCCTQMGMEVEFFQSNHEPPEVISCLFFVISIYCVVNI